MLKQSDCEALSLKKQVSVIKKKLKGTETRRALGEIGAQTLEDAIKVFEDKPLHLRSVKTNT